MTLLDLEVVASHTYRPQETGVGCAAHNDPNCLCDVRLNGYTPVLSSADMMFGTLAERAVIGSINTPSGFADWLCQMGGLHEIWLTVRDDKTETILDWMDTYSPNWVFMKLNLQIKIDTDRRREFIEMMCDPEVPTAAIARQFDVQAMHLSRVRRDKFGTIPAPQQPQKRTTAWSRLPPEIRETLKEAYKRHVPWSEISHHVTALGLPSVDYREIARYYNVRLHG